MPVLITIATVTALLAGNSSPRGQNRASILDPASLRQRLKRLPEGETRARALAIADDLQRLRREHAEAVSANLDAYEAQAERWESSAESLIALMAPHDATFVRLLDEVIRARQALLDTLSPEDWSTVFD